mgnify:CR=1 FL=1
MALSNYSSSSIVSGMRIFLILILFYLVGCSSNPFDDDIPYKQRFDDGLAFFEEENTDASCFEITEVFYNPTRNFCPNF